jgi:hypothetical protein
VLELVAAGLTNGEIAVQLITSVETVKKHVGHLCAKLGLGNRTEAAAGELDLLGKRPPHSYPHESKKYPLVVPLSGHDRARSFLYAQIQEKSSGIFPRSAHASAINFAQRQLGQTRP